MCPCSLESESFQSPGWVWHGPFQLESFKNYKWQDIFYLSIQGFRIAGNNHWFPNKVIPLLKTPQRPALIQFNVDNRKKRGQFWSQGHLNFYDMLTKKRVLSKSWLNVAWLISARKLQKVQVTEHLLFIYSRIQARW